MINIYDVKNGTVSLSAQTLSNKFLPTYNDYSQNLVNNYIENITLEEQNKIENKVSNSTPLDDDILDSIEFIDTKSNNINSDLNINKNDFILESIDYSEFSDKDED